MTKRFALAAILSGTAAAVLVGAAAPAPPDAARPAANTVTITVSFDCDGKRSVDPWEAHAKPGDDIEWVLDDDSDADRLRIKPKKAQGWPLAGGGGPEASKGNRGRGKIKGDAARGRSSYDIEARCGNEWRRIDPDIIID